MCRQRTKHCLPYFKTEEKRKETKLHTDVHHNSGPKEGKIHTRAYGKKLCSIRLHPMCYVVDFWAWTSFKVLQMFKQTLAAELRKNCANFEWRFWLRERFFLNIVALFERRTVTLFFICKSTNGKIKKTDGKTKEKWTSVWHESIGAVSRHEVIALAIKAWNWRSPKYISNCRQQSLDPPRTTTTTWLWAYVGTEQDFTRSSSTPPWESRSYTRSRSRASIHGRIWLNNNVGSQRCTVQDTARASTLQRGTLAIVSEARRKHGSARWILRAWPGEFILKAAWLRFRRKLCSSTIPTAADSYWKTYKILNEWRSSAVPGSVCLAPGSKDSQGSLIHYINRAQCKRLCQLKQVCIKGRY